MKRVGLLTLCALVLLSGMLGRAQHAYAIDATPVVDTQVSSDSPEGESLGISAQASQNYWVYFPNSSVSCSAAPNPITFSFTVGNIDDVDYEGTYSINLAPGEPTDPVETGPFSVAMSKVWASPEFTLPSSMLGVDFYVYLSLDDGTYAQKGPIRCGTAGVTKSGSVTVSTANGQPLPAGTQICFDTSCSTFASTQMTPFTHTRNSLVPGQTYTITVQGAAGFDTATTTLTMPPADGPASASTSLVVNPATTSQQSTVRVAMETEDGADLPGDAEVCVDAVCYLLGDHIDPNQSTLTINFGLFGVGAHNVTITNASPYDDESRQITVVAGQDLTVNVKLYLAGPPNQNPDVIVASTFQTCGDGIDGIEMKFSLLNFGDTDLSGHWVVSDGSLGTGVVGAHGDVDVPSGEIATVPIFALGKYFLGKDTYLHVEFDDGTNLDRNLYWCGSPVELTKAVNVVITTADGGDIPAGAELCLDTLCTTLSAPQHSPYTWVVDSLPADTTYDVTLGWVYPYEGVSGSVTTPPEDGADSAMLEFMLEPFPPSGEITVRLTTEDDKPLPPNTRVCVDDVCVIASDVSLTAFEHLFGVFEPGTHTISVSNNAPYNEFSFPFVLEESQSIGFDLTMMLPGGSTETPTTTPSPTASPTATATTAPSPTSTSTVVPSPTTEPKPTFVSTPHVTAMPTNAVSQPTVAVSGLPDTGSGRSDTAPALMLAVLASALVITGIGIARITIRKRSVI